MEIVASHRCHGGWQRVLQHDSRVLGCSMRLGVYLPPAAEQDDCPVLYFLSGLTCTEQNAITKSGAQRWCAEHGLILVTPDTSPRGAGVADDEAWDLGQGAGFYLTATEPPWSEHYRMDTYVTEELPELIASFTSSHARGITGHSMGGHGAIVLALRNPGLYRSVSAFAPILQPSVVPWGIKAFTAYLGDDRGAWGAYDATSLLHGATERLPILIDQGADDDFLVEQLVSDRFLATARELAHPVERRLQPGYDHSYYFVASFLEEHVAHHAAALHG
ncbi:MAG TPA: S-formylglutathione hydrolase [Deltaproteobacteria bacterium]|nr:S-formylglutathione hydrolase [Deltaproteobacteria bacterium]